MSIREPAVAGMFYESGSVALREQIESCFLAPGGPGSLPVVNSSGPRNILGLVSPHAGYMYSGSVAASAYHRLASDGLPDVAVIMGPNHRSYSPAIALSDQTSWRTPMGEIQVDAEITNSILEISIPAQIDNGAHHAEHSLEVQVPFLQYLEKIADAHIRIVPILIGAIAYANSVEFVRELGSAIAKAIEGKNAVLIASTDFTHYEKSESAAKKDTRALEKILALDEEGLLDTVDIMSISMCGVLPTAVTIAACKKLGVVSVKRLAYQNSGDVTGDYSSVVGYSSLELHR